MTPIILLLVMKWRVNIRNKVLWCMSSVPELWRAEFNPWNRCLLFFSSNFQRESVKEFPMLRIRGT